MNLFESQFQKILDGIKNRKAELGQSHPLYSSSSLFVVPGSWKSVVDDLNKINQPFVVIFPAPAITSTVSSPVFSPNPFSGIPTFGKSLIQRLVCLFQSIMMNVVFGRIIPYPIPMLDTRHLYTKATLRLVTSLPFLSMSYGVVNLSIYLMNLQPQ